MPSSRSDVALDELLAEGQEIVESLGKDLLVLDGQASGGSVDPERIAAAMRSVHTLKGLAALFGAPAMAKFSHRLEDLLDLLRSGRTPLSPPVLDILFEASERYGHMIRELASGAVPTEANLADLMGRLERVCTASGTAPAPSSEPAAGLEPSLLAVLMAGERRRLDYALGAGLGVYRLRGRFTTDEAPAGLESLRERLRDVGEVVTTLAGSDPPDPGMLGLDLLVVSGAPAVGLARALARPGDSHPMQVDTLVAPRAAAESAVPVTATDEATRMVVRPTVRVEIRRVDRLIALVGELRGSLGELPAAAEARLAEVERLTLQMRMVPLASLFDKLARLVRTIAREAGKEIELHVDGADTSLDKALVEELSDPLMHLLRNAIDHGVEPLEARLDAGKPPAGQLRVSAHARGDKVVLAVSDDGLGLDEKKILASAVKRGLVSAEAAATIARRDALELLFVPGFSTREHATQLSGRGVGMDVVRTNIARFSGIIDLDSTAGKGTVIRITVPATLAVAKAVYLRVAGRLYAVPQAAVLGAADLGEDEVQKQGAREIAPISGQDFPLLRPETIYRLDRNGVPAPPRFTAVVMGIAERRLALAVDELIGVEELVTRRQGEQVIVIDVAQLLGLAARSGASEANA